jgi:hypothetical protein
LSPDAVLPSRLQFFSLSRSNILLLAFSIGFAYIALPEGLHHYRPAGLSQAFQVLPLFAWLRCSAEERARDRSVY